MCSYPKEFPTMLYSNTTEDFSFPVISSFKLSSTSSSSLWRISSKVHHLSDDEHDDNEEDDCRMEVRSLSEEMLPSRRELFWCSSSRREDVDREESMDYLWQNFNEEDEMCKGRKGAKQICVMQGTKMGTRPISKLLIGKLLKGLLSFRKPSHLRFLKARF